MEVRPDHNDLDEEAIERRMLDRREIVYLRDEVILLRQQGVNMNAAVNDIKATLRVAILFLLAGVGGVLWVLKDTRAELVIVASTANTKHEQLARVVRANGLDQIHQDNSIISVLNVVSLNQKRVMINLELPYMSPERVDGLLRSRTP